MTWIGPYATEELADAACAGSSSSSSTTPGDDCADAPELTVGTEYDFSNPGSVITTVFQWVKWSVTAGTYHIDTTPFFGGEGASIEGTAFQGTSCDVLSSIDTQLGFCTEYTVTSDGFLFFEIGNESGGPLDYTVKLSAGGCPSSSSSAGPVGCDSYLWEDTGAVAARVNNTTWHAPGPSSPIFDLTTDGAGNWSFIGIGGVYTVSGWDGTCCQSLTLVGGGSPPTASFCADCECDSSSGDECEGDSISLDSITASPPSPGFEPQNVNYTANITGGVMPFTYAWTFASGSPSTSTLANPEITYNSVGTFAVNCTVTDDCGNDSSNSTTYTVEAPP